LGANESIVIRRMAIEKPDHVAAIKLLAQSISRAESERAPSVRALPLYIPSHVIRWMHQTLRRGEARSSVESALSDCRPDARRLNTG
jgi:hypothetical protein